METLDSIAEKIHQAFEARTAARDQALGRARTLTRHCANAIRAIHRAEFDAAEAQLADARHLVTALQENLDAYPDIYYAGYTQDALKEFAEATLVYALVKGEELPGPDELHLEHNTYIQGLAEAASELRRRCLDKLLNGDSVEAQRVLGLMDGVYGVLVTMDYPDAITGGLRRLTDLLRGVTERTRGDLALSLQQERLGIRMRSLEERLSEIENEGTER